VSGAAGASGGRPWLLVLALLLSALLHALSWAGLGLGAFVIWESIHAFYFQQSYAAGIMPLALAGLLAATSLLVAFRRERWASVPAFGVMILSLAMLPRMGAAAMTEPYLHPMQLVHWVASALGWAACIWLFARTRAAAP
jgi:hypothetical protein